MLSVLGFMIFVTGAWGIGIIFPVVSYCIDHTWNIQRTSSWVFGLTVVYSFCMSCALEVFSFMLIMWELT